jgi:hypothetical protein
MKRWIRNVDRFFLKRKIESFSDKMAGRYGFPPDGSGFYTKGMSMKNSHELEQYIETDIRPRIENIELEYKDLIVKYNVYCQADIEDLKYRQAIYTDKLSDSTDGYLKSMKAKIGYIDAEELTIKEEGLQEKAVNEAIKGSVTQSKHQIESILKDQDDLKDLISVHKLRRYLDALKLTNARYDGIMKKMGTFKHSLYYPPTIKYVIAFYSACALLTVAEFGFSLKVIGDIMDTQALANKLDDMGVPVGIKVLDILFSVIYCVGMPFSFAFIWKYVMDRLLHWNIGRLIVLVLLFFMVFSFLAYFFSDTDNPPEGFSLNDLSREGIIPAFLSVSFAVANALAFREAIYLHHQLLRINRYGSRQGIEEGVQRFKDQCEHRLAELQQQLLDMGAAHKIYDDAHFQRFKKQLANLEKICIAKLRQGFERRERTDQVPPHSTVSN